MELSEQLIAALDSPDELECLYRRDPDGFSRVFPEVFAQHPGSSILQTWQARLNYAEGEPAGAKTGAWRSFLPILLITLAAGTLLILPNVIDGLNPSGLFYPRNIPLAVLLSLVAYFVIQKRPGRRILTILLIFSALAAIHINLLPDDDYSDTFVLSALHLPFFIWCLSGLAYVGKQWRDTSARVNFIRFNGDLFIYATLLVMGSGVLIGLGVALFSLLYGGDVEWVIEFFMKYIFWYGLVGIPLLATWLIERAPGGRAPFASILARVFSPLFLLLVVIFIIAMLVTGTSPFLDRDALIIFNLLLVVVLAITVFSILERSKTQRGAYQDVLNLALALVTLTLDALALSAILFRLTAFGLTPNRIAVLGANLLFFIHLLGICWRYFRLVTRRGTLPRLEDWIVGYLPVYALWVVFVAVAFPLIFQFR